MFYSKGIGLTLNSVAVKEPVPHLETTSGWRLEKLNLLVVRKRASSMLIVKMMLMMAGRTTKSSATWEGIEVVSSSPRDLVGKNWHCESITHTYS